MKRSQMKWTPCGAALADDLIEHSCAAASQKSRGYLNAGRSVDFADYLQIRSVQMARRESGPS